jgi:hypothetical protein
MRYKRVHASNSPTWWRVRRCWWVDGIGVVHRLRDAKRALKNLHLVDSTTTPKKEGTA